MPHWAAATSRIRLALTEAWVPSLHHSKMWTTFGGCPAGLCFLDSSCNCCPSHNLKPDCRTKLSTLLGQVPMWFLPAAASSEKPSRQLTTMYLSCLRPVRFWIMPRASANVRWMAPWRSLVSTRRCSAAAKALSLRIAAAPDQSFLTTTLGFLFFFVLTPTYTKVSAGPFPKNSTPRVYKCNSSRGGSLAPGVLWGWAEARKLGRAWAVGGCLSDWAWLLLQLPLLLLQLAAGGSVRRKRCCCSVSSTHTVTLAPKVLLWR